MIVYVIRMDSADTLPLYYDPAAGRATGAGMGGWTQDPNQALGFSTMADANKFINALLPRTSEACRAVAHERK